MKNRSPEGVAKRHKSSEGVRGGSIALTFMVLVGLIAAFAPQLAPYGFNDQDYDAILEGMSASHWLGTDDLGRDVMSRLIYGTRASVTASLIATSIAIIIGVPAGLLAGFGGKWADAVIMRILDTLLSYRSLRSYWLSP